MGLDNLQKSQESSVESNGVASPGPSGMLAAAKVIRKAKGYSRPSPISNRVSSRNVARNEQRCGKSEGSCAASDRKRLRDGPQPGDRTFIGNDFSRMGFNLGPGRKSYNRDKFTDKWTLDYLTNNVFDSLDNTFDFCMTHGLLSLKPEDAPICTHPGCDTKMRLTKCSESESHDRLIWMCTKTLEGQKRHRTKCSIRNGTMFSSSNLSIAEILLICYLWTQDVSNSFVEFQYGFEGHTVVDWFNFCRELVEIDFFLHSTQVGGPGKIVEIDESKFGKRKYHRGHRVDGKWVFGIIERDNLSNILMVPVENRTAKTLLAIIKDWVIPGTTIMSDCWKSYDCLEHEGFKHLTVNHTYNFVDPDTGACTNLIEGSWLHAKKSFPKYGTSKDLFDSYLGAFLWRWRMRHNGRDLFESFLSAVRGVYPPK